MKPTPPTARKKIRAYWLRKGNAGFLLSDLWMNSANAGLTAKGKVLANPSETYNIIPVEITCTLPLRKGK